MTLKALQPKDPFLRKISEPLTIKELKNKKTQAMIEELLNFVYDTRVDGNKKQRGRASTVGLSANQVGILKRISIVDLGIGHRDYSDIHTLINPEITWRSKTEIENCEGCVNLPDIWGYIKRSKRVKVKAWDRSGNKLELDLKGWPAILLQHELGHLNGELFIDHLADPTKAHLAKAKDLKFHRKLKKKWTKFIDVSSLIKQKNLY